MGAACECLNSTNDVDTSTGRRGKNGRTNSEQEQFVIDADDSSEDTDENKRLSAAKEELWIVVSLLNDSTCRKFGVRNFVLSKGIVKPPSYGGGMPKNLMAVSKIIVEPKKSREFRVTSQDGKGMKYSKIL